SHEAIGNWNPPKGLILNTSATDFPTWKHEKPMSLDEGPFEYKYVICDNDGNAVRWEERANRTIDFEKLAFSGALKPAGVVSVTENFSTMDPDEVRFWTHLTMTATQSATGSGVIFRATRAPTSLKVRKSGDASQGLDIFTSPGGGESTGDWIAPTIRERLPSNSMIQEGLMQAFRTPSRSCFGDILDEQGSEAKPVDVPPGSSPAVEQPGWEMTARGSKPGSSHMGDEIHPGGDLTALVREESCSNLFMDADEKAEEVCQDSFLFEEKYSLVGNGPLGEGTFGLVWRCTPKNEEAATHGKEMAAKIVRK
ncbi:unnamed protein product, partial [Polarella glacialis]